MDPHPDAFHFLPAYQLAQLNLLELQSPSGALKFSGFKLEWLHLPVFRIGVNNPLVTSPCNIFHPTQQCQLSPLRP